MEDKPENKETTGDVAVAEGHDEEDEDDEEEGEVDVLGTGSEGQASSTQLIKANRPSNTRPPSAELKEDDGWVTKKKRLPRSKAATNAQPTTPEPSRPTKSSTALRGSPYSWMTGIFIPGRDGAEDTAISTKTSRTRKEKSSVVK
ncbi:hypothetical protein E2C01_053588 [Portunus trituberculatus]|uniref:Uncharacterized protein n=1 Tax=Portunus trituberculatus TaxID=210409 RepID=A0A5B7GSI6_PORTR|nr:hypothetical protein [Portunus trituberculatus]